MRVFGEVVGVGGGCCAAMMDQDSGIPGANEGCAGGVWGF